MMRWNLPNVLAMLRVLIAPLMLWMLLEHQNFAGIHESWIDFVACCLFVFACATDFFDGYIARAWGQQTTLGMVLDPLADKMLTLAAFLGLMMIDRANIWAVYLILVREFFITGLRVMAAADKMKVAASMAGKVKTTFQMIAASFLIMNWMTLGTIALWIAVALTLYSGLEYTIHYAKAHK
jgi:CDP-diacylglycerol--glycerol-3-phosphate 3-phosphatidyltransferase